jgi:hypothetical protein
MASKDKTTYKVDNWPEYNKALCQRGSLNVWISEEALEGWLYEGPTQQGAQFTYSDFAIETCLSLRAVFGLAFRQTQGFVESLFEQLEVDLPVPDYSIISRRQQELTIPDLSSHNAPTNGKESMHILIDSTGLKVYGEGEWKQRQHGKSKRRTWRKLHLGVDAETGMITAAELTDNGVHDCSQVKSLLEETTNAGGAIGKVGGDGAYDKWVSYEAISEAGATPIIPPQKNAKIKKHGNCKGPPLPRDQAIRYIRAHGRKKWKQDYDYHQRSLAEAVMWQFKTLIGRVLKARKLAGQQTEARIGCKVLNQMMQLGMPQTYAIPVN